MLDKSENNLEIKFLQTGCGDAIKIRFLGNDNQYRNILIDGGTDKGDVYNNTIRKEILNIISDGNQIYICTSSFIKSYK
ncbi:MAG: hypothetical protein V4511_01100 [Bacteroidota bacterium]